MQRFKSRKLFTIALAIVLTLSLATTALAAWTGFQNNGNSTNNGVVSTQPPITAPTLIVPDPVNNPNDPLMLPTSNPNGDVYSGIDTTSVINNGVAYTLYNGGVTQGLNGGARLQATNITNAATVWNIQLDGLASNSNQLSTPYLIGYTLYAAVTVETPIYGAASVNGWSASGTASISGTTATFAPGTTGSISTTINLANSVSYIYLPTNLYGSSGTYTITLDGTTLASGSLSTYRTYDAYNGPTGAFSAGNHTLTITVNNNTSNATVNEITLIRYDWRIWSVNTANGAASMVIGAASINPLYEGQINTPLSGDSNISGNFYFGTFGGTHSYYQYNTATSALTTFAANDDFYGAGAVVVNLAGYSTNPGGKYSPAVVFGSESGTVYVQSGSAFATTLTTYNVTAGDKIRSSMAYDTVSSSAGSIYFTSYNSAGGTLWQLTNYGGISTGASTLTPVALPGSSTSTPVISQNGYIYTGWFGYDYVNFYSIGGVVGLPVSNFTTGARFDVYGNGITSGNPEGDPVQSSPIVWSDDDELIDYVCFTTNADHTYDTTPVTNHNGYCYSVNVSGVTPASNLAWNPPTGGTYALQGFASDGGYLIYGDDSNTLYIFH